MITIWRRGEAHFERRIARELFDEFTAMAYALVLCVNGSRSLEALLFENFGTTAHVFDTGGRWDQDYSDEGTIHVNLQMVSAMVS